MARPGSQSAVQQEPRVYKFAGFTTISGGQLTNYGVHNMDMIRWCLGVEYPRRVTALEESMQFRTTAKSRYTGGALEYDGILVTFSQYNANAAARTRSTLKSKFEAPREPCTSRAATGRWYRSRARPNFSSRALR